MNKTKIDIISGFLGAGKTTFIKELVRKLYQNEKVVILENEFGKINIDKETLGREGLEVKSIQASCICCSGSGELYSGIYAIMEQYAPDRIIIEPTGIAKLTEVKRLIQDSDLEQWCEIDHIITIVDAKNYRVRTMISKEFFEDQIRASQVIFLSRTDQMDTEEIEQVKEAVSWVNKNCIVIAQAWDTLDAPMLTRYINHKQEPVGKKPLYLNKNHKNDFENYEIIQEKPIPVQWVMEFARRAEAGEYGEIHRIKGICLDPDEGWYSLEGVPGEMKIDVLGKEQVNQADSRICIIGRDLNRRILEESADNTMGQKLS